MLFTADETGDIQEYWPIWDGDESMLLHLPSMMFDEYVSYVPEHRVASEIEAFMARIAEARVNWRTAAPLVLFIDIPVRLLEDEPESPVASLTATVRMDYGHQRVWTRTEFTPKSARDLLLTFGHQLAWNWVFSALYRAQPDEIDAVLDNMVHQVDYYREVGVAKDFFLQEIGRAPFYAMGKGSGSRYVEELAASAGMTADEFRHLPKSEKDRLIDEDTTRALEQLEDERRTPND